MTKTQLNKVKIFVKQRTSKLKDPQHGWSHLSRVANYAMHITKTLSADKKIDTNLLQAACFLHDINHTYYSPGIFNYFLESKRLKKVLPKILSELSIPESEKEIIENAIYSSPFSFPFRKLNKDKDLYTQILQDADTLDFFSKERERSFKSAVKDFSFYAFLSLFSNWALKYGRKNLYDFLNNPEIAKQSYV